MKRLHGFLLLISLLVGTSVHGEEKIDFFKFKDIRPGMKGYILTVIRGHEPRRIPVTVTGKAQIPNEVPIILIRGKGMKELGNRFNVMGFSGSPLFIQGKIAGAVGYGFSFNTDRTMGVVPFELMDQEFNALRGKLDMNDLVDSKTDETFVPGASITVAPVIGAAAERGTGTVTWVKDGVIYAFGHPMGAGEDGSALLGPVHIPAWRSAIAGVIPRIDSSFKLQDYEDAATLQVTPVPSPAATVVLSGKYGIYAIAKKKPRMVPMRVTLATESGSETRTSYVAYGPGFADRVQSVLLSAAHSSFDANAMMMKSGTLGMKTGVILEGFPEPIFLSESYMWTSEESCIPKIKGEASVFLSTLAEFDATSQIHELAFQLVFLPKHLYVLEELTRVIGDEEEKCPVFRALARERGTGKELIMKISPEIPAEFLHETLTISLTDVEHFSEEHREEVKQLSLPNASLSKTLEIMTQGPLHNNRLYLEATCEKCNGKIMLGNVELAFPAIIRGSVATELVPIKK